MILDIFLMVFMFVDKKIYKEKYLYNEMGVKLILVIV